MKNIQPSLTRLGILFARFPALKRGAEFTRVAMRRKLKIAKCFVMNGSIHEMKTDA